MMRHTDGQPDRRDNITCEVAYIEINKKSRGGLRDK
jgi:hypothetical protein